MKKSLFSFTIILIYSNLFNAQIFDISPYYGIPNSLETGIMIDINYIDEVYGSPFNETVKKTGPIGLTIGYISNKNDKKDRTIGYSLDFNYSTCDYDFSYNSDSLDLSIVHNMNSSRNVFRAIFNLNYHYSKSLKFDPYISVGTGLRLPNTTFSTTNPDFIFQEPIKNKISLRLATGLKYYFNNKIGVLLETGLGGGGFLRFGLSYRTM